jgi:DNA modification methylase
MFNEDCRKTMKRIRANSIDSIVTDPPYEYNFMNKSWDNSGIAFNVKMWKQCYRILKPGGYLLAFGGPRTSAVKRIYNNGGLWL